MDLLCFTAVMFRTGSTRCNRTCLYSPTEESQADDSRTPESPNGASAVKVRLAVAFWGSPSDWSSELHCSRSGVKPT
jgi:hypothetical protein